MLHHQTLRSKSKVVSLHVMKAYGWGRGVIAPLVLTVGTRREWVVSFTLLSLYHRGGGKLTIHKVRGWISCRADWEEIKASCPWLESNHNSSVITFISISLLSFVLFFMFDSVILSITLHFLAAFFLYVTRPPSDSWLNWQTDWIIRKATLVYLDGVDNTFLWNVGKLYHNTRHHIPATATK
jgi:hypothetical protein